MPRQTEASSTSSLSGSGLRNTAEEVLGMMFFAANASRTITGAGSTKGARHRSGPRSDR